jgi:hypothetical protein
VQACKWHEGKVASEISGCSNPNHLVGSRNILHLDDRMFLTELGLRARDLFVSET